MKKRLLSIALTLCMIVANMSALSVFALAEEATDYSVVPEVATEQTQSEEVIEETEEDVSTLSADDIEYLSPVYKNGDYTQGLEDMVKRRTSASLITKDLFVDGKNDYYKELVLYTGTYVIKDRIEFAKYSSIFVYGKVELILADDCYIQLSDIVVEGENSIEIYGQKNNTGKIEMISNKGGAGIGGSENKSNGKITINGGDIVIHAHRGAGIGGGDHAEGSNIIINGGIIDARGSSGCAGIGGGNVADGHHIYINGGKVTAHAFCQSAGIGGGLGGNGHHIYINGGKVNAYGINSVGLADKNKCGAGIGGGGKNDGKGGNGYDIYITGGIIDAKGGDNACGIGGGYEGSGYDIYIDHCGITAVGRCNAAGIGGGKNGTAERITIKDSIVEAYIDNSDTCSAAGIGGGANSNGTDITIDKSSVVHSTGGKRGAGIGGGDNGKGSNIFIKDSYVTAYGNVGGAGIGGGDHGNGDGITIDNSTVEAHGDFDSAGIGGGEEGAGLNITIKNNSNVTAYGSEDQGGAGIGGGQRGKAQYINIEESKVKAYGGHDAPGIGGGGGKDGADGYDISILNSDVYAQGDENGAGIGAGTGCMGDRITIDEKDPVYYTTKVVAKGGYDGSGIGGGDAGRAFWIYLYGGEITATGGNGGGAGIGGGCDSYCEHVDIGKVKLTATGGTSGADGIGSGAGGSKSSYIKFLNNEYILSVNGQTATYDTGDMAGRLHGKNKVEYKSNLNQSVKKHVHKWSYKADGDTIYASCKGTTGTHEVKTAEFIQLHAPEDCTYDGTAKKVRINGSIDDVKTPTVKYYKGSKALKKAPSAVGTYTAKITLGKATASVTYTIAKAEDIEKYNADLEMIEDIQLTQNAALAAKSGKITVSWAAAEGYEMTSYQIYRATSKNGKYSKVATVKSGTLKYVNAKSLKKGKTYYYKVRGVVKFGALTAYTDWSEVQSAKCRKTVK